MWVYHSCVEREREHLARVGARRLGRVSRVESLATLAREHSAPTIETLRTQGAPPPGPPPCRGPVAALGLSPELLEGPS